jgi:hypothetical protein
VTKFTIAEARAGAETDRMGHHCHAGERNRLRDNAQGSSHQGFVAHAQRAGAIVLLSLVVWAVTGMGTFWPIWVIAFLGLKLANHARYVYGSGRAGDGEADGEAGAEGDLEPASQYGAGRGGLEPPTS